LNLIRAFVGIPHHRFNLSVKCSRLRHLKDEARRTAKMGTVLRGPLRVIFWALQWVAMKLGWDLCELRRLQSP
jgi:hypothetical protein